MRNFTVFSLYVVLDFASETRRESGTEQKSKVEIADLSFARITKSCQCHQIDSSRHLVQDAWELI